MSKLLNLRTSRSPALKDEELKTEVIGRALTERISRGTKGGIKKKILLNWRKLYSIFKKSNGKSGLVPADEFHRALRVFGI